MLQEQASFGLFKGIKPDIGQYELPWPEAVYESLFGKDAEIARAQKLNPRLRWDHRELFNLVNNTSDEIRTLEMAARTPDKFQITREVAHSIKLVIRFSGPGTYNEPIVKDERQKDGPYRPFKWSRWMDRYGADAATFFGAHLVALTQDQDISYFNNSNKSIHQVLFENRLHIRKNLSTAGFKFLYSGNSIETAAIRNALTNKDAFVPSEKVDIREDGITNTASQVADLKKYLEEHRDEIPSGSSIVLVAYSPHATRILSMCKRINAISQDIKLIIVPLPTPTDGLQKFIKMEIKGMVYYFLTEQAALESAEHQVVTLPYPLFN